MTVGPRTHALGTIPADGLVDDIPMPDIDVLVARTSALLAEGVPLSLLLDLADGPYSVEIMAEEPADDDWLHQGER